MATITNGIVLDTTRRNIFRGLVAKQNDVDSRFLTATITNDGEIVNIESGATVFLNVKRIDGESSSFTGKVNADGTVTVPLTAWALAYADKIVCDISVVTSAGVKLSTCNFDIDVQYATNEGGEIDPDDPNADILVQLIARVETIETNATKAAEAVQNMGVAANTLSAGSKATVQKSVNQSTGAVTLTFGIPQGDKGEKGDSITVDATLSGTSPNPVQNKAVTEAVNKKAAIDDVQAGTEALKAYHMNFYLDADGDLCQT